MGEENCGMLRESRLWGEAELTSARLGWTDARLARVEEAGAAEASGLRAGKAAWGTAWEAEAGE